MMGSARDGSSLLLLTMLVAGALAKLPLPDYVEPCSLKLSDKKMSECALQRARNIMPHVYKGDPKYNVPVLDPLHVSQLVVIDGKGPLGMRLVASDVDLYGLPRSRVDSVVHSTKPPMDTYALSIPDVNIKAKYNISGRILLLPLEGQGNVDMNLKNVRLVYQFDYKFDKLEDGEIYYLPLPGARLDIDCDGMNIKLDNLFNGDKALVETTNNFLNDEWREVFDSLKPSFAEAISKVITDILNGIFRQVPLKSSFLDVDESKLGI